MVVEQKQRGVGCLILSILMSQFKHTKPDVCRPTLVDIKMMNPFYNLVHQFYSLPKFFLAL